MAKPSCSLDLALFGGETDSREAASAARYPAKGEFPTRDAPLNLEELLRGVTDANPHGEWNTDPSVGKEI